MALGMLYKHFFLKNTKVKREILVFSTLPAHVVLIIYHFVDPVLPDSQKVSVELYKDTVLTKLHLHAKLRKLTTSGLTFDFIPCMCILDF